MSNESVLGPTGILMEPVEVVDDTPLNSPEVTQALFETETNLSMKAGAAIDLIRWKSSPAPAIDPDVLVEQSSEYEAVQDAMSLLRDEREKEAPRLDEINSMYDPSMPLYKTKHHDLGVSRAERAPRLFSQLERAIEGLTGTFKQSASIDAEHVGVFDHFVSGLAAWSPEHSMEIAESFAVTGSAVWGSVRPILERYSLRTPGPWRGMEGQLQALLDNYPAPPNGRRAARRARELATAARQSYRHQLIEFVKSGK